MNENPQPTPVGKRKQGKEVLATSQKSTLPIEKKKDLKNPEEVEDERVIRLAVAKLHTNLGHPSNKALARAIRLTGGSDLAIATALGHQCPVCDRLKNPTNPSHQAAGIPEVKDFGRAIAIDLFTLADCFGKPLNFLNVVCLGSGYQIVTPVGSKHPNVVWDALHKCWMSWAGPPDTVICDGGGEFRQECSTELEDMSVKIKGTAALSPTQNAMCERKGGHGNSMRDL